MLCPRPGRRRKRLALRMQGPEIHLFILQLPNPAILRLLYLRLTVSPDKTLVLQIGVVQGDLCAKVSVSAGQKSKHPLRRSLTRRKGQQVADGGPR